MYNCTLYNVHAIIQEFCKAPPSRNLLWGAPSSATSMPTKPKQPVERICISALGCESLSAVRDSLHQISQPSKPTMDPEFYKNDHCLVISIL